MSDMTEQQLAAEEKERRANYHPSWSEIDLQQARIAALEAERDRLREALAEANTRITSLEILADSAEVDTVIFVRDREAAAMLAEREECASLSVPFDCSIPEFRAAIRARPAP